MGNLEFLFYHIFLIISVYCGDFSISICENKKFIYNNNTNDIDACI